MTDEANDGSESIRHPVLNAGGVPEHFNFAWHRPETAACLAGAELAMTWTDFPGGTGAMVEALTDGRLDVASLLTEGAVAAVAHGAPIRIISTWTTTPLIWGVHVTRDHAARSIEDLRDAVFAISRYGSGSHLMAEVMAHQRAWPSPNYEVVRSLEGAREAMGADAADGFLWEKYTTKPLVDSGEWRRIGEVPTPWPGFVIAASTAAIEARRADLEALLTCLQRTLDAVSPEEARAFIAERYRLQPEDVAAWFAQTAWRCEPRSIAPALESAIEALVAAGVLAEAVDPESLCWPS